MGFVLCGGWVGGGLLCRFVYFVFFWGWRKLKLCFFGLWWLCYFVFLVCGWGSYFLKVGFVFLIFFIKGIVVLFIYLLSYWFIYLFYRGLCVLVLCFFFWCLGFIFLGVGGLWFCLIGIVMEEMCGRGCRIWRLWRCSVGKWLGLFFYWLWCL